MTELLNADKSMFDSAVSHLLRHEGGYSNRNPKADPGGETNFGISKRYYPKLDIKNLKQETAKGIYKRDYWDAHKMGNLPEPLALTIFDFGVNAGPMTSIKMLQRIVGAEVDGVIGPETLGKVGEAYDTNAQKLLDTISDERMKHYKSLKNWEDNKNGWTTRNDDTLWEATAMRMGIAERRAILERGLMMDASPTKNVG